MSSVIEVVSPSDYDRVLSESEDEDETDVLNS
jgi:hypothetical protein